MPGQPKAVADKGTGLEGGLQREPLGTMCGRFSPSLFAIVDDGTESDREEEEGGGGGEAAEGGDKEEEPEAEEKSSFLLAARLRGLQALYEAGAFDKATACLLIGELARSCGGGAGGGGGSA